MKYSESALKKMLEVEELNLEDQIKFNILNFIRTIHLNNQDFIESYFRSEYFGEQPMIFQKNEGQVIGLITVTTTDGEVRKYVFNNQGYEPLEDLLGLAGD